MKHITIKSVLMYMVAVILLTLGSVSASAQYYMNVVQKDGEKVRYLVSNIDSIYFSDQESPVANYEYVDLGLSVKWATFNVGATKPEEYGDYYTWGETEPYYEAGYAQKFPHWKEGKFEGYSWSTYKWGSYNKMTKYCSKSNCGNEGFTDNKTTLDAADDVAHVKWGGNWRMPTMAEQDDLLNNCTWTWYSSGNTKYNGVAGYEVTSNIEGYTDRSIFLPAAGYYNDTSFYFAGSNGYYWSSSLSTGSPNYAWVLKFYDDYYRANGYSRNSGLSVRPVCP